MAKVTSSVDQIVVLELTKEEVEVIFDILQRVGGSPTYSRRKLADNIVDALSEISTNLQFNSSDQEGEIRFLSKSNKTPSF